MNRWPWVALTVVFLPACGSSDRTVIRRSAEDGGAAGDGARPEPVVDAGAGGQAPAEPTSVAGGQANGGAPSEQSNAGAPSAGNGGADDVNNGAGGAQECVPLDLTAVPSVPVLP